MLHRSLALMLVAFLLVGCASPATPAGTPVTLPPVDIKAIANPYPNVDGSTSTLPLAMLIACKMRGVPYTWGNLFLSREKTIIPDIKPGTPFPAIDSFFPVHNGTHGSYLNLIEGKADLILVARAPSEDEEREAAAYGVGFDVRPIALDAFVFLVNAKNPVETLRIEQIRDVYTGKTADWSALGGSSGTIKPYTRDRNSGSQELMEALVMKGATMVDAPDMMLESMIGPINAVGSDLQGLGYSVYYYANFMLPDERVKMLSVGGVKPSVETIAGRAYPLTTEVYGVLRAGTRKDNPASLLRDWLLTAEGKKAVVESGYVPWP